MQLDIKANQVFLPLAFVRLQQLISPSLPVGAFTYSQGMEWAVECGWLKTADDVHAWLESLLFDTMLYFELPLLKRLHNACAAGDEQAFAHYSALMVAGRETKELRLEEAQRARALVNVLNKLPDINTWPLFEPWQQTLMKTPSAGFAMACCQWQIPVDHALGGYAWAWLENMVMVAIKLVPLGQSDGQRVLYRLSEQISAVCQAAKNVADSDIGASSPAMAIASSLHETQYCRLFRS